MASMQPGDFALSINDSAWYATVICWVTRGRFSHIRLITSTDGDCVEAVAGGVRRGRVRDTDVVATVPLTPLQRAMVPTLAEELIGTPYGWVDVFILGLAQVGVKIPWLSKPRLETPKRLFCSQLVDLVLRRVGYHAFTDGRTPGDISPNDWADWALRQSSAIPTTERGTSTRKKGLKHGRKQ